MKQYEEYKDTGIGWLPKIPSHWKLEQLRKYIRFVSKKGYPEKQLLSVTREQGVIVRDTESKEENHNFIPEDLSGYKYVQKGQLVINKMKSWQGSYGVSDYEGIVSPAYFVCDLRFPNKKFFSMALRSRNYVCFFAQYSKGIRVGQWDLSPIALKSIPFFEPPLAEQEKIVSFLESKTLSIDAYVAERERELQLLNELKESEIANVITRGLNPDVKMKDSRIPWIGMIPEHWREERAKYLFNRENRPISDEDDIITCFRDGQVTLRKNRRTTGFTESFKECGYQGIRKGDLVIHQMDAFAGSVGISDSDGKGTPVYIVCTPKRNDVYNPYFALVIREMGLNGYIQSLYRGIRERSSDFKFDVFRQQCLPLPPIEEQKAIVAYIEDKCNKISSLIGELEAEIEYLKEYKQKLIADCVTGQINVQ